MNGYRRTLLFLLVAVITEWTQATSTTAASTANVGDKSVSAGGTTNMEDSAKQIEKFTSELIKNDKIREVYINCLLDKVPCSQEAGEIKNLVPDAVQKGCSKCTEVQQKIIEKMMLYLKEKQPEILHQVTTKFDPKGDLMNAFIGKLQQQIQTVANETRRQPA